MGSGAWRRGEDGCGLDWLTCFGLPPLALFLSRLAFCAVLLLLLLLRPSSPVSSKHRLDSHIQVLHAYNEIKDVVQALMGKCAEMEGRTTRDMYDKFGLDLED